MGGQAAPAGAGAPAQGPDGPRRKGRHAGAAVAKKAPGSRALPGPAARDERPRGRRAHLGGFGHPGRNRPGGPTGRGARARTARAPTRARRRAPRRTRPLHLRLAEGLVMACWQVVAVPQALPSAPRQRRKGWNTTHRHGRYVVGRQSGPCGQSAALVHEAHRAGHWSARWAVTTAAWGVGRQPHERAGPSRRRRARERERPLGGRCGGPPSST